MEKELLYKSAEKSLANKDYFKAAEELSKLYVEYGEKNFRINYLLFISFKNLNEHERAVETAEECLESYIRDNCKFSQYLGEKILSGGMIQALQLKKQLEPYMKEPEQKYFSQEISEAFEKFLEGNEKIFQKVNKRFAHCGSLDFHEQSDAVKEACCLDENSYVKSAKRACSDEYLHPMICGSILSELKKLGYSEKIQCFCPLSNEVCDVIPSKLCEIDESVLYMSMKKRLEEDLTIPFDLKARYLDEIKIKLMMIWPQMQEFNETSGEVLYSEFIGKRVSKRSEWFEKQLKVLEK